MTDRWGPYPGPAPLQAHLDDAELLDASRSGRAAKHLSDCGLCQSRLHASRVADDSFEALLAELDATDVSQQEITPAAGVTLPSRLVSYLQPERPAPDVIGAGQLWRLSWNGRQQLAVVLRRNAFWVDVAPVTVDTSLADEYTLILPADATSLGQPTAVYLRARGTVPLLVLDTYLGTVGASSVTETLRSLEDLIGRHRAGLSSEQGEPVMSGVTVGAELQVADWDRQAYQDALDEDIAWFSAAAANLVDDDGHVRGYGPAGHGDLNDASPDSSHAAASAAASPTVAVDIADELHRRRGQLSEIVTATGLDPKRLLALATRKALPTPDETRVFAQAFGFHAGALVSPFPPELVLLELAHPRFRALRERWTRQQAGHADSYEHLGLALERILGSQLLSARTTGGRPTETADPGERIRELIPYLLALT